MKIGRTVGFTIAGLVLGFVCGWAPWKPAPAETERDCEMLEDTVAWLEAGKAGCEADVDSKIAALYATEQKGGIMQVALGVFWYAVGDDLGWDIHQEAYGLAGLTDDSKSEALASMAVMQDLIGVEILEKWREVIRSRVCRISAGPVQASSEPWYGGRVTAVPPTESTTIYYPPSQPAPDHLKTKPQPKPRPVAKPRSSEKTVGWDDPSFRMRTSREHRARARAKAAEKTRIKRSNARERNARRRRGGC